MPALSSASPSWVDDNEEDDDVEEDDEEHDEPTASIVFWFSFIMGIMRMVTGEGLQSSSLPPSPLPGRRSSLKQALSPCLLFYGRQNFFSGYEYERGANIGFIRSG